MAQSDLKGNNDLSVANRDPASLCPWFALKVDDALKECEHAGYPIMLVECFRSPARQDLLYAQGRSLPGKRVTDAKAWQSFHQYGLAIDICFVNNKKPFWPKKDDALWDRVDQIFEGLGFESIGFERPHHQISRGVTWQEAYDLKVAHGMQAVWDLVALRSKY